jgi:hypothetical protein
MGGLVVDIEHFHSTDPIVQPGLVGRPVAGRRDSEAELAQNDYGKGETLGVRDHGERGRLALSGGREGVSV